MNEIDAFIGINMGTTVYQVFFNTAVRNITKMHADERPKLHLAATREIMWQPPDNHTPKK